MPHVRASRASPMLRCRCRDAARSSRRGYLRALRAGLTLGLGFFAAGLLALLLAFSAAFGTSALAASVFVSAFVSGFAASTLVSALASDLASSLSAPARLRLFSLSPLKSVSYQPEPFSRNTGADMSLRSPFFPQVGHFFSGLSLIFCSTSSRK